jgi:hypothetical protein
MMARKWPVEAVPAIVPLQVPLTRIRNPLVLR